MRLCTPVGHGQPCMASSLSQDTCLGAAVACMHQGRDSHRTCLHTASGWQRRVTSPGRASGQRQLL